MRNLVVIWRRELAAMFMSPVAYVVMAVFFAAAGGTFLLEVFKNTGSPTPLEAFLFEAAMVWLTFLLTVVTMRLFAEEKRSGTIETLMTAPVTEAQVVLGKHAAALTSVLIVLAPVVGCPYLLKAMSPGLTAIDAGAMTGGCIFLALFSLMGVAMGGLISLMTDNQITAAICCFCALWLAVLGGWLLSALPFGLEGPAEYLSVSSHLQEFDRGLIDSRPIVLYVSVSVALLFASVRVLESRRWR